MMKRLLWLIAALWSLGTSLHAIASGRDSPQLQARTGVVATPKAFPRHSPQDVANMFALGAELGSFTVIRVNWNDARRWEAAQSMMALAEQRGLDTVLEFNALKPQDIKGASLDAPKDALPGSGQRLSLRNPAVAENFSKAVLELAELRPGHLALATDVNLLQLSDEAEFEALAALYKSLYPQIKRRSPDTKLYVSFQWDALQRQDADTMLRSISRFQPKLDLLTFSSDPRQLFAKSGPDSIPTNYYSRIARLDVADAPVFLQLTWPSEGDGGERQQAEFIRQIPKLTAQARPAMLAWTFLHDVKLLLVFTARLGLYDAEGRPKPALAAWKSISTDRPSSAKLASGPKVAPRSTSMMAPQSPAQFAVFTARKDGSQVRILISDAEREMSHPRVSPDRTRVVITRYTRRGRDGKATEEQGYEDTEILVMNLDGTGLETVLPAKRGVVTANGCWTPDGKALIYISTDNPQRHPEIRQIDLATRQITRLPTPPGLRVTDPHWEAGKIVFPAKAEEGKGADALWVMNADGSGARQITRPSRSRSGAGLFGDFDPKLSPDGRQVAFMRNDGGASWRIFVVDLVSGEERLLTPAGPMQWLPTWSSDGQLLLYVHVDLSKPREVGLYTMRPDGTERRMVPLPRGFLYGHSTFFPGDGSSDAARIIFNGTPKAGL